MEYKYLYSMFDNESGEDFAQELADNSYQDNFDLASGLLDDILDANYRLEKDYKQEVAALEKGEKKSYEEPFARSLDGLRHCLGLVQEMDFIGQHTSVSSPFHKEDYFDLLICAKNMQKNSLRLSPYRSSAKDCFTSPNYREYLYACRCYKGSVEKRGPNLMVGLLISLLLLAVYIFLVTRPFVRGFGPYLYILLVPLGLLCFAPLGFQWIISEGARPKDLERGRRSAAKYLFDMDPEQKSHAAEERLLFGLLEESARALLAEEEKREKEQPGAGQAFMETLAKRYKDMDANRAREILRQVRDWFADLGAAYDDAHRQEEQAQQRYGKEFS